MRALNIIKGAWRSKVLMERGEQVPAGIVVSIIADTCASPPRPAPPRLLPAPPLFRPHPRQDLTKSPLRAPAPGLDSPQSHICAKDHHICTSTRLPPDLIRVFANAWTAPRPIRTDWAHPTHGCTGKGVAAAD